jgi:hypothetical protein
LVLARRKSYVLSTKTNIESVKRGDWFFKEHRKKIGKIRTKSGLMKKEKLLRILIDSQ